VATVRAAGIVLGGPYKGQYFGEPIATPFPRWWSVLLVCVGCRTVRREIREEYLEQEYE
jgi:hypothetical protein